MNWAAVLEGFVYYAMLLGLPSVSVIVYFVLLSHHHTRLQERYTELKRMADRRRQRELSAREQERLRDPLFRFHRRAMAAPGAATSSRSLTAPANGETPIQEAIAEGKFVLHDTAIEQVDAGMVLGAGLELEGRQIDSGTALKPDLLKQIRKAGIRSLPILFNPDLEPRVLSPLQSRTADPEPRPAL